LCAGGVPRFYRQKSKRKDMKNLKTNELSQSDIAILFTSHSKLDLGDEQGLHDFEGRLLADFQGSFTFSDYDHQVSYELQLGDEYQCLNILHSIEIDDFYLELEYRGGGESLSLANTEKDILVNAEYSGSKLMKVTLHFDNQTATVERDTSHAQGIAPVFKRVI
jgi:hypothetical protein